MLYWGDAQLYVGIESTVTATPPPTPTDSPEDNGEDGRSRRDVRRKDHIGWIVAGSLAAGLLAALLLAAAPVHRTRGERHHRRSSVRIRTGLGDVGRALGAVHRASAAMGRSTRAVHGSGWSSPDLVRHLGAGGAQLGVAARVAGAGDLDVCARPSTASWPEQAVAALPSSRGVGPCRDRRRLRDRARSGGRDRVSDARSVDRRRRTPLAPALHRLRQPHGRAGTRCRRLLLGDGMDSACRG